MRGIIVLFLLALASGAFLAACSDDSDNGGNQESPAIDEVDDIEVNPPELPPQETDGGMVASCAADEALSWDAAADHVGTEVILIGPVFDVQSGDSTVTITIGSDQVEAQDRLNVILTENAAEDFRTDATELFADDQVCVRGVVQTPPEGGLRMVVNEAESIQRL